MGGRLTQSYTGLAPEDEQSGRCRPVKRAVVASLDESEPCESHCDRYQSDEVSDLPDEGGRLPRRS